MTGVDPNRVQLRFGLAFDALARAEHGGPAAHDDVEAELVKLNHEPVSGFVLFVIDLERRRVETAAVVHQPHEDAQRGMPLAATAALRRVISYRAGRFRERGCSDASPSVYFARPRCLVGRLPA